MQGNISHQDLNPIPYIKPPGATPKHPSQYFPRKSSSTQSINSSEASSTARPPEHLSEFYSFMSNKPNAPLSPVNTGASRDFPPVADFKDRKNFNRQPSLNTFTSFSPSVLDLPSIVTSKDFQSNIDTYTNLMDKASKLRESLLLVSTAANEFGQALEDTINDCPKVNNSRSVCDGMLNAGGLQYMIGSNQQILSRLISTSFEEPLKKELAKLQDDYNYSYGFYQKEVKLKLKLLREKELENIKLSKLRTRNLNTYKNNLLNLTNQLDEIDRLKYDYYHEINSMIERFNNEHLLIKTGSLVRAQLEVFEGIAKKGWSGGGLDELLAVSPDLFEGSYDSEENIDNDLDNTLDKSSSVATFRQNTHQPQAPQNLTGDVSSIKSSNTSSVIDEEDQTFQTETMHEDSTREPSPKTEIISKLTLSNFLKGTDLVSADESFSLPVVNNSNSLLPKSKASPETVVDSHNILDELDD